LVKIRPRLPTLSRSDGGQANPPFAKEGVGNYQLLVYQRRNIENRIMPRIKLSYAAQVKNCNPVKHNKVVPRGKESPIRKIS